MHLVYEDRKEEILAVSEKPNTSRRICIRPWKLYM